MIRVGVEVRRPCHGDVDMSISTEVLMHINLAASSATSSTLERAKVQRDLRLVRRGSGGIPDSARCKSVLEYADGSLCLKITRVAG